MPQMTRVALLAFALAALFLAFQPDKAHAEFGDCTDPSYPGLFDERLDGTDFACQERMRVSVYTEAGQKHIRLLYDRNTGGTISPEVFGEYERGISQAAQALGQIGSFRMDDVTILLDNHDAPAEPGDPDSASDIGGGTYAQDDECRITIYLLAEVNGVSGNDNGAFHIAHEIFHCVQLGTLSQAQMTSGAAGTGSGGDWWLEGSAEWFAVLAIGDSQWLRRRLSVFDKLSPDTPLYELAYSASIFFLWLDGVHGPQAILPFLEQMAGSSAASAQRSAMRNALDADKWLAFAQAYLDGDIRFPNGGALPLNPAEGDTWRWTETRTETITLEPFVLHRGWIEFDCGRWLPRSEPEEAHAVREDGGAWGALPERIDTRDGDADRYRFVGFAAQSRKIRLRITGELEAGCEPCGGSNAIDACIVGSWQETGGGPIEWMQKVMQRPRLLEGTRRNVITVYESDGTYATAPLSAELTVIAETNRGDMRGDSQAVSQTAGRWSAEDGQINLCQDQLRFRGKLKATSPDGMTTIHELPISRTPETVTMRYACSESNLETTLTIPGVPEPMVTQYSRLGRESE